MKEKMIEFIIGSILATITQLLGGWDLALETLIIMMTLDYITGVLKALHNKKISSLIGAKGIIKKVGYLIIIALAVILDGIIFDSSGAIRMLVIYFFIANEGISIVENWVSLGLPMPDVIKTTLEQLKNRSSKNETSEIDDVVNDNISNETVEEDHGTSNDHEVE